MSCDLAHDLLQQSLDGTPIESPEWLAHLRDCADCRALASASRRLQEGLRMLSAPQPPADLTARIVEKVLLSRRRERRRTRIRWAVGLALAAGLLIALMLRLEGTKQPPGGTGVSPVAGSGGTGVSPVVRVDRRLAGPHAAPTLRESAAELGEVFAALSNETADETVGQTRRWVSNVPSPSLPHVDLTAMEPPTRPWREAGEGVSEGMEPVTTSARRAVGLFLRDLPMETETH